MCFPWALAGLLPSAVQVRMRSRSTSARPPSTANIKAPGAGAGVGPPFAECRDHEIATGSITADATSDRAGFAAPSACAHRHRSSPIRPTTADRDRRTAPGECRTARRRETPRGGPRFVGPHVVMREICYS